MGNNAHRQVRSLRDRARPLMPGISRTKENLDNEGVEYTLVKTGDPERPNAIEVRGLKVFFSPQGYYHSSEML